MPFDAPENTGPLAVRFYQREIQNEFLTTQEGRPICSMQDFIRIEIPGNNLLTIDTFVNEEHKKRFPLEWARFQNEKSESGASSVEGTSLRDWPLLTAAQATELKHFKFYTVEQIANAADQQINSLGMAMGMSPFSLRDKARAYLANAKDSALVQAQTDALRQRDQEISDLKHQMEQLMREMSERKKPSPKPKDATQPEAA